MLIAIPRESIAGENRVAMVPESVKRLVAQGFSVAVEASAGAGASLTDADYQAVGARI